MTRIAEMSRLAVEGFGAFEVPCSAHRLPAFALQGSGMGSGGILFSYASSKYCLASSKAFLSLPVLKKLHDSRQDCPRFRISTWLERHAMTEFLGRELRRMWRTHRLTNGAEGRV